MEEKLVWRPTLKNKGQTPATETNKLAGEALKKIKEFERMRAEGTLPPPPKKPSKFKIAYLTPLLLLPLAALFFDARKEIQGKVWNGKVPLKNATVQLHGKQNKDTTTDEQGKFKIEKVSPGVYKMTISHKEIDSAYGDPEKTLFKIGIGDRDIKNLQVYAQKKMPRPPTD